MVGCSVDGYKWCLSRNVVGAFDGNLLGDTVGILVLKNIGSRLEDVGSFTICSEVGNDVGCTDGINGDSVGYLEGDLIGLLFGFGVGSGVGILVGLAVNVTGPAVVGNTVGKSM